MKVEDFARGAAAGVGPSRWEYAGAILFGVGLALVTSVSSFCSPHTQSGGSRGPVVIYLVDTLRPDRMSAYGAAADTSPAAAALGREGIVYENAFALSTWTRASVATLLTSRLPSENGVWNRFGRIRETVPYLPELFRQGGWTTAAFVGNGNVFDPRSGFARGFDVFQPVLGAAESLKPRAREVVDRALAFIERQKSSRFFLLVHVVDPHLPYDLEPEYAGRLDPGPRIGSGARAKLLELYDLSIRQSDDQFARIAESLEHRSWWQDAAVVYVGDHGEEFYEHGAQGHGRTLYDEQVRVPLLFKPPAGISPPGRRSEMVSLADLAPTLAGLSGLPASRGWMGRDLMRPARGASALYMTEELDDVRVFAARTATRKLVVQLYPRFGRWLYDLSRDPAESNPVSLPCAALVPSDPLYRWLLAQRSRDVSAGPGVEIRRSRGEVYRVDVLADLRFFSKPFVTDEQLCLFASGLTRDALRVRRETGSAAPFDLILSADDRGRLVPVRFALTTLAGAPAPQTLADPVSVVRRLPEMMIGPTSDDLIQQLKALGYLTGGTLRASQPGASSGRRADP